MLGSLLALTVFLYGLDVYATSRVDEILHEYYGNDVYERLTSKFDPDVGHNPDRADIANFDTPKNYGGRFKLPGYYKATTAKDYYRVKRDDDDVSENEIDNDNKLDPDSQAINDNIEVRLGSSHCHRQKNHHSAYSIIINQILKDVKSITVSKWKFVTSSLFLDKRQIPFSF